MMRLSLSSEIIGSKSLLSLKFEGRDAFQISVCIRTWRPCVPFETIA